MRQSSIRPLRESFRAARSESPRLVFRPPLRPSGVGLIAALLVYSASALCPPPVAAQQDKDAKKPSPSPASALPDWKPLYDGKTLGDWKVTNFGGQGEVHIEDGAIVLEMGSSLTGITYPKEFPRCDYELLVEAKRIDGVDFFSTVTFPVGDMCCSFVVGGWAGAVVGISSIDHADASENETTKYMKFNKGQWYRIRIAVGKERIRTWIDDKPIVDVEVKGRKLSTRAEVELSKPLGVAAWETRAAVRKIEWRELPKDNRR